MGQSHGDEDLNRHKEVHRAKAPVIKRFPSFPARPVTQTS